jgi:hypothetical protein
MIGQVLNTGACDKTDGGHELGAEWEMKKAVLVDAPVAMEGFTREGITGIEAEQESLVEKTS